MSKWICPRCGGGFPALADGVACPWCEFTIGEAADLREGGYIDDVAAIGNLQ